MPLMPVALRIDPAQEVRTSFPKRAEEWRVRQSSIPTGALMANTRASIPFNARTSDCQDSLSIIILQPLIKLAGSPAISKAVFRNFVQFSSLEVITDVLAV